MLMMLMSAQDRSGKALEFASDVLRVLLRPTIGPLDHDDMHGIQRTLEIPSGFIEMVTGPLTGVKT